MSTTTIRLEDALKRRVARAAKRAGKSPHAFIVDAIAETVAESEVDDEFHRLADARWEKFLEDGRSLSLAELRRQVMRSTGGRSRKRTTRKS